MSDHAVFRRNDVPYLFFSCGMWAHYHQPTDTPNRLNYHKTARVAQLCHRVLAGVDQADLEEDKAGDHTLAFEIETFRKLVGPALPLILRSAGIRQLETRTDIEKIVEVLIRLGLSY